LAYVSPPLFLTYVIYYLYYTSFLTYVNN